MTVSAGARITLEMIREWECQIRDAGGYTSCVITNFVELEG